MKKFIRVCVIARPVPFQIPPECPGRTTGYQTVFASALRRGCIPTLVYVPDWPGVCYGYTVKGINGWLNLPFANGHTVIPFTTH